jgi:cysteine desulfurase
MTSPDPKKRYYFDHSATTRVDYQVAEAMIQVMNQNFGNPSSVHNFGRDARVAIEEARETVARYLAANSADLFFTSGGTEADNLALIGVLEANRDKGNHLITSKIEHHAVLDTAKYLEGQGFLVSYVSPDQHGMIQPDEVARAITSKTVLVSIMHVNNEVGTINPIEDIARITHENGALFHTDAVQSFGKLPINVKSMNIDLLSLSAHKIYGPKGCGALYIRKGIAVSPRTFGGHQERNIRTGTENLPGIIGLAKAAGLCHEKMTNEAERLTLLRDRFWDVLQSKLAGIRLNGHPTMRLPGLNNISFQGIEGEALLLSLDLKGIAVSTGSACSSGQVSSSHVLLSMGIAPEIAQGSIRFSMGRENDDESVDYALQIVPEVVKKLRDMAFGD